MSGGTCACGHKEWEHDGETLRCLAEWCECLAYDPMFDDEEPYFDPLDLEEDI